MAIKEYFKKSIRNKGVLSMLIPLLIAVIFAQVYYPDKQKSLNLESVRTQVQTLSDMLAFSAGAGLKDNNIDLVQAAFEWAKKDKNVIYIVILNETKSILKEYNPQKLNIDPQSVNELAYDIENNYYKNGVDVNYKDKTYGKIVMFYSLDNVTAEINKGMWTSAIAQLLIFLFGAYVVILIFNKLSKSIVTLRDAARKASSGDLHIELEKTSEDEVGDLTESFKIMLKEISIANQSLEIEKRSVEGKIVEAI